MQQGQVSVWIPLVVGIIGLIGVIAGQLVNAWREDRRWKRDQQREELRWSRQQQADNVRRTHEDRLDWRDRRLQAYSEFLHAVLSIARHSGSVTSKLMRDDARTYLDEWDELAQSASALQQKVRLLASEQLRAVIKNHAITLNSYTWLGVPVVPREGDVEALSQFREKVRNGNDMICRYYHELDMAMREDLGISTERTS